MLFFFTEVVIMLTMKPKKPKTEVNATNNPGEEVFQCGWRVDQKDMHIFHGISKWAEENRYSRNMAMTIAIEFFLKSLQKTDPK